MRMSVLNNQFIQCFNLMLMSHPLKDVLYFSYWLRI